MNRWFRAMGGKILHLSVGREKTAAGLVKLKTACGKVFFDDDGMDCFRSGERVKCKKCFAAQPPLAVDLPPTLAT